MNIWQSFTGKTIRFDRADEDFGRMLLRLLRNTGYDQEEKITECIRLVEKIDSSEWAEKIVSEDEKILQAFLFSAIVHLESEEMLLTCIRKKLITKDVIPALIKCALVFKKKKLIPVLLLYKN